MDIRAIDKNFDTKFDAPDGLVWHSVHDAPFATYGIDYSEAEGLYRRLPREVADSVSPRVSDRAKCTAGGRIRFTTDSPFVAVRVESPFSVPFSHMTVAGEFGVSIFINRRFLRIVMPSYEDFTNSDPTLGGDGRMVFYGLKSRLDDENESGGSPYMVELFLPLYSAVNSIYVGLKEGSVLTAAPTYKHQTPILFYGSSITQGGCAAKPGDDYVNRLSRMLDTDVRNLGFSGSAMGEASIAAYIALPPGAAHTSRT